MPTRSGTTYKLNDERFRYIYIYTSKYSREVVVFLSHQYRFHANEKRSHTLRICDLSFIHGGIPVEIPSSFNTPARLSPRICIMCAESAEGKDEVGFNGRHTTSYSKARGSMSNHFVTCLAPVVL